MRGIRVWTALAATLALSGCPGPEPSEEESGSESTETGVAEDPGHDPLSMPAEPTLNPADFESAEQCAGCHPTYYAEWQLSRHGRAMRDPVFRAMVELRQDDLDASEDQFCAQCHSAICTRGGECVSGFDFAELSPISLEGVTCVSCHRVSAVERDYNSGHLLDPEGPLRGPLSDPQANAFHDSEYAEHFDDSVFCGGCHDVIETSGLNLERPYAEWLESPAAPDQNCQSCHMPTYSGQAAVGGPEREGLHRHRFIGVDLPMEGDVDDATLAQIDAQIEQLLQGSASLTLDHAATIGAGQQLDVQVTIRNLIAGHAFPTGSTFIRQVWLDLRVQDANDQLIYATGELDSEGDLGDFWSTVAPYSDPDLIVIDSGLTDIHGTPELFSWRATEHTSTAISPLHDRTYTLFVPVPADAQGPLQIEAALHFRAYPPFLLRMLGLEHLIELAVVREVATSAAQVEVL